MSVPHTNPADNTRRQLPNRRVRRTASFSHIEAERLAALRFQAYIVRCQIANPHNERRRALLVTRLDLVDGRAADLRARLIEARAP